MTDTTTIEVRTDQAEQLQTIQRENGNYKTAIDRLLESRGSESEAIDVDGLAARIADQIGGPRVDDNEIARGVAREFDYAHLADNVSEQVIMALEGR
jgi:hypothetical protein